MTYWCAQATGQISNLTAVDTTLASQIAAANQLTGLVNQTATAGLAALNSRVTLVCGQSYIPASALRCCSLCTSLSAGDFEHARAFASLLCKKHSLMQDLP